MTENPLSRDFAARATLLLLFPPVSSCRAGATRRAVSSDRYRFFVVVNGRKSSSHCTFSMSSNSCQRGGGSSPSDMSGRSKEERYVENEVQSCASNSSCQSGSQQKITDVSSVSSTASVSVRRKSDSDGAAVGDLGSNGRSKLFCEAEELGDPRNVEDELIEEGYPNDVEYRGMDSGNAFLQILANTYELQ
jgi:hypothetical protein